MNKVAIKELLAQLPGTDSPYNSTQPYGENVLKLINTVDYILEYSSGFALKKNPIQSDYLPLA